MIFLKIRLFPIFSIFNWKFKAQFSSIFACGPRDRFYSLMRPPSQFEFETPALLEYETRFRIELYNLVGLYEQEYSTLRRLFGLNVCISWDCVEYNTRQVVKFGFNKFNKKI